jgi:hypothetical protein
MHGERKKKRRADTVGETDREKRDRQTEAERKNTLACFSVSFEWPARKATASACATVSVSASFSLSATR